MSLQERENALREVCDTIKSNCSERFASSGHLVVTSLLNKDNFPEFEKDFPVKVFKDTIGAFPFLEEKKLKN